MRVQPAVLRATLSVVLIGAGLALLIKAGLDLPIWVLVPFPLGVAALMVVTMVRASRARAAKALAAAAETSSAPTVEGRAVP